jgi:hypothetical protein
MPSRRPLALAMALLITATLTAGCASQYHATISKDFTVPKTVALVAVLDAQKEEGSFLILGMSNTFAFDEDLLSDKITRYLVGQRLYSVVERASVDHAIAELALSTSDLFDNLEIQKKLGELCSADHIVIARASMTEGWFALPPMWWKYVVLEARAIDVESGRVMWAAHAGGWDQYVLSSDEHMERVVAGLFSELSARLDEMSAEG